MPDRHQVATTTEIPVGEGKSVEVQGKEIALFQVEGSFYAIDNTCPHAGGPLAEGEVEAKGVTCPWHAWTFCLETGVSSRNAAVKVNTYPVIVEGDAVFVEL